ncbi:hypothetical protein [Dyadobacter sp. CY323]|uniref:hypothetical protein n=1 Tax=Dyadobacter sp. CY323 TaxID=2907302 RepID=UPI001F219CF0|nr:hypothetical protein [Dyadobacter sp. CY323]MCE6990731.1 hypothetical protein [Dyadobacter sp. CY323]
MSLTWKSNFSGTEHRIFRGKIIAGLLKTSTWKNEGYGELNGHLVRFKTKGFLQKKTDIQSIDGDKILGNIEFHFLKSAATITYNDISYEWKFEPWSRRKWFVANNGTRADFKLSGFWQKTGEVQNEDIPAAVLLASLYTFIYFQKTSAAV